MNIEAVENIVMLIAVIAVLLGCLFRYIDVPRRGYLFLCISFLAHLLSDYYWATYTLVMKSNPEVSELIAYFGWNVSYLFLIFAARSMQDYKARRFFNPLMLLPIPLNIFQFWLYIQYGGYFNNTWALVTLTAAAVICIQSLTYYMKTRNGGGHFPYVHTVILVYIAAEYGMWTSSCFDWPGDAYNPYYYFEFITYLACVIMPIAAAKDYGLWGLKVPEKSAGDLRFQFRIQIIVSFIILGGCAAGYYLAVWTKNAIPAGIDVGIYRLIAIMLFMLSIFMSLLVLGTLYLITVRYRNAIGEHPTDPDSRRNRFNLIFTILITLGLMIFSVIYNSRLFYDVSVTRLYEAGSDKAASTANSLENYLAVARSTLDVTADTIDMMLLTGEPQDKVLSYLTEQTQRRKMEFDENFTGIYGTIRGEYMDGSGWEPPEGYDPAGRDWYNISVNAGGRTVIVPPYIDAQTHSVVLTITRLLSVKNPGLQNTVSLDVLTGHIQDVIENVDLSGKGYAMISDRDGRIVAHRDPMMNGENIRDVLSESLSQSLKDPGTLQHGIASDNENTLFISPIMDQWYVLVVVSNSELFADIRSQVVVNIFVSLIIFGLITGFYYFGYKNEQAYSRKVEEMRTGRQKQEYEAEVLKLEKLAADEANKAKSSFLADMSHEIRTPINAILGMNEMIMRKTGEDDVLEYSKNIKSAGHNLLMLINSILDFSKIEDGKMEILPVRYSLASLINYLVNSVKERMKAKSLAFNVDIDPTLPSELYGDDVRVDQVIVNLLTNAAKYTHEGSVTLTVSGKERKDDMILLYVEVRDTGIGIKEDDMERLFESFERLDVIRNRNIEGTGLGLSIVTKLLYLMGSALKVQSTYGEGSVFSFELWQKVENEEPIGGFTASSPADIKTSSYRESFHAAGARVLIVDDTNMNLMVAENLLKDTQIITDTAESGQAALDLCAEYKYDVILLDQRMPGMDGTQTLSAIRAQTGGKNTATPAVCLTADAIRGAKERYLSEGFSDYLAKPVEGHELEKMMLRYIPKEKVEFVGSAALSDVPSKDSGAGSSAASASDFVKKLSGAGINTASGLRYCQQDENIYRSILMEYHSDSKSKAEDLRRFLSGKDWENYSIIIHSLKSTSKTIGANELSQICAELEGAADRGDEASIVKDHDKAMALYDEVCSYIADAVDVTDYSGSDDDILEFSPD
ncbi:MAG: response regulator [Lachnospiraceae bacterium]|nr:response regulator [Lachnospiraceae bacterium]